MPERFSILGFVLLSRRELYTLPGLGILSRVIHRGSRGPVNGEDVVLPGVVRNGGRVVAPTFFPLNLTRHEILDSCSL
jgi:hypothetical protein